MERGVMESFQWRDEMRSIKDLVVDQQNALPQIVRLVGATTCGCRVGVDNSNNDDFNSQQNSGNRSNFGVNNNRNNNNSNNGRNNNNDNNSSISNNGNNSRNDGNNSTSSYNSRNASLHSRTSSKSFVANSSNIAITIVNKSFSNRDNQNNSRYDSNNTNKCDSGICVHSPGSCAHTANSTTRSRVSSSSSCSCSSDCSSCSKGFGTSSCCCRAKNCSHDLQPDEVYILTDIGSEKRALLLSEQTGRYVTLPINHPIPFTCLPHAHLDSTSMNSACSSNSGADQQAEDTKDQLLSDILAAEELGDGRRVLMSRDHLPLTNHSSVPDEALSVLRLLDVYDEKFLLGYRLTDATTLHPQLIVVPAHLSLHVDLALSLTHTTYLADIPSSPNLFYDPSTGSYLVPPTSLPLPSGLPTGTDGLPPAYSSATTESTAVTSEFGAIFATWDATTSTSSSMPSLISQSSCEKSLAGTTKNFSAAEVVSTCRRDFERYKKYMKALASYTVRVQKNHPFNENCFQGIAVYDEPPCSDYDSIPPTLVIIDDPDKGSTLTPVKPSLEAFKELPVDVPFSDRQSLSPSLESSDTDPSSLVSERKWSEFSRTLPIPRRKASKDSISSGGERKSKGEKGRGLNGILTKTLSEIFSDITLPRQKKSGKTKHDKKSGAGYKILESTVVYQDTNVTCYKEDNDEIRDKFDENQGGSQNRPDNLLVNINDSSRPPPIPPKMRFPNVKWNTGLDGPTNGTTNNSGRVPESNSASTSSTLRGIFRRNDSQTDVQYMKEKVKKSKSSDAVAPALPPRRYPTKFLKEEQEVNPFTMNNDLRKSVPPVSLASHERMTPNSAQNVMTSHDTQNVTKTHGTHKLVTSVAMLHLTPSSDVNMRKSISFSGYLDNAETLGNSSTDIQERASEQNLRGPIQISQTNTALHNSNRELHSQFSTSSLRSSPLMSDKGESNMSQFRISSLNPVSIGLRNAKIASNIRTVPVIKTTPSLFEEHSSSRRNLERPQNEGNSTHAMEDTSPYEEYDGSMSESSKRMDSEIATQQNESSTVGLDIEAIYEEYDDQNNQNDKVSGQCIQNTFSSPLDTSERQNQASSSKLADALGLEPPIEAYESIPAPVPSAAMDYEPYLIEKSRRKVTESDAGPQVVGGSPRTGLPPLVVQLRIPRQQLSESSGNDRSELTETADGQSKLLVKQTSAPCVTSSNTSFDGQGRSFRTPPGRGHRVTARPINLKITKSTVGVGLYQGRDNKGSESSNETMAAPEENAYEKYEDDYDRIGSPIMTSHRDFTYVDQNKNDPNCKTNLDSNLDKSQPPRMNFFPRNSGISVQSTTEGRYSQKAVKPTTEIKPSRSAWSRLFGDGRRGSADRSSIAQSSENHESSSSRKSVSHTTSPLSPFDSGKQSSLSNTTIGSGKQSATPTTDAVSGNNRTKANAGSYIGVVNSYEDSSDSFDSDHSYISYNGNSNSQQPQSSSEEAAGEVAATPCSASTTEKDHYDLEKAIESHRDFQQDYDEEEYISHDMCAYDNMENDNDNNVHNDDDDLYERLESPKMVKGSSDDQGGRRFAHEALTRPTGLVRSNSSDTLLMGGEERQWRGEMRYGRTGSMDHLDVVARQDEAEFNSICHAANTLTTGTMVSNRRLTLLNPVLTLSTSALDTSHTGYTDMNGARRLLAAARPIRLHNHSRPRFPPITAVQPIQRFVNAECSVRPANQIQGFTITHSRDASPLRSSNWKCIQDVPRDISGLTVDEVCECLRLLNMSVHMKKFRDQQIDGSLLQCLDKLTLLQDFGFSNFDAIKLSNFSRGWRPKFTEA